MAYTIVAKQPPARDAELEYDAAAPGLYAGETLVKLGTGEFVAAAVSSRWLANGAGVSFKAWARQANKDGSTKVGPEGQEIATSFVHSENPVVVAKHGIDVISRETLMAVLGEKPTLIEAPGGKGAKIAMVPWSEELKSNVSIRVAIAHAKQTDPLHNVASLLS